MHAAPKSLAAALAAALVWLAAAPAPAAEAGNPHNTKPCTLCHAVTPRFGVDTRGTVTFRTSWDDPALCAACHRDEENIHPVRVAPGAGELGTVAPKGLPLGVTGDLAGQVVCTTCHFIHASDTGHALLRGFRGAQDPARFRVWQDLCRDCHGAGLEKRSPHGGDERSCVFCHQARPAEGQKAEVTARAGSLCNFCHGGVQDRHYARANPYGREVACYICHDPHAKAGAARLRESYVVLTRDRAKFDPHYRRALCYACHLDGEGAPLRAAGSVELCNRCHGAEGVPAEAHPLRAVPASITPPEDWPLDGGRLVCLTCHTAGHPEDRGRWMFLRGGPYPDRNDFCANCHDPEANAGRNPHADINAGKGCEFCHAARPVPGKDNFDTVKLIADPNLLCLRCHSESAHPAGVEHTISLDPERAKKIPREVPLYRSSQIVCATCHNPHVAEDEGHKLRGEVGAFAICSFCHRF